MVVLHKIILKKEKIYIIMILIVVIQMLWIIVLFQLDLIVILNKNN